MEQSKSKHTPGPWTLTFDGTGILALSKKGTFIKVAESLTVQLVDGTGDHSLTPAKVAANARLIAAAPELLEALEVLVAHAPNAECEAVIRALIAKAKGGAE